MTDRYFLEGNKSLTTFEFKSQGVKDRMLTIQFSMTNKKNVYNLGFGEVNHVTGEINDEVIIDNGDTQKILNTVASSIPAFFEKHPNTTVLAKGSTPARTRLYRRGITNNLSEIRSEFDIFGFSGGKWHEFKKGEDYDAFLITQKDSNFAI